MFKRSRIPKSLHDKLKALDQYIYLLRENLRDLKANESHLKIISAGLRTLICKSSGTEGLLWRLVDEFNLDDSVFLHLTGKVNPDHPLSKGLTFSFVQIFRGGKGHLALKPDYYSLKYVIKQCEAVFVDGKSITHEDLIRKIAEQLGISHEDDGLEPALLSLKSIFLNGVEPYIPILVTDTELTIEIGERIMDYAEKQKNYNRILHKDNFGNVSLVMRCQIVNQLASRVPILIFRSFINDIIIICSAGPLGLDYQIKKHNKIIKELIAPYSENLQIGDNLVFTLSYCSKSKKIRTITNDIKQKTELISDLGWMFAEDISVESINKNNCFIKKELALAYERLLSTKDSIDLLELKNISDLFIQDNNDKNYEFPD
jgi:hypothetical protein